MKGKTIGYIKNLQNVPNCVADVDLKVGMGVILDREALTAKLPAGEDECKACIYVVSNINVRADMDNFADTLTVHKGEYVRADDLTTVNNMEMEFAAYEISTEYAQLATKDKLVFDTTGLLKKAESVEGYRTWFEIIGKTAYMGKGVLVICHAQ